MSEPQQDPDQQVTTAVVTLAHGRHDHLERQQESLSAGSRRPDLYVVVAMQDDELITWQPEAGVTPRVVPMSADPDQLPLAAARNVGATVALQEGADVVVFLDVDCLAGDDLVASYAEAACSEPEVLWSGPVTYLPATSGTPHGRTLLERLGELDDPHPSRPSPAPGEQVLGADPDLFWSLSFAVHRQGWSRTGGFCEDYVGYGGEDTDFARVAVQEGLDLGWLGSARAYHQHHPTETPPVGHLDDILRNGRIFRERWGRWPMEGWLRAFEERGLAEEHDGDWRRVDHP